MSKLLENSLKGISERSGASIEEVNKIYQTMLSRVKGSTKSAKMSEKSIQRFAVNFTRSHLLSSTKGTQFFGYFVDVRDVRDRNGWMRPKMEAALKKKGEEHIYSRLMAVPIVARNEKGEVVGKEATGKMMVNISDFRKASETGRIKWGTSVIIPPPENGYFTMKQVPKGDGTYDTKRMRCTVAEWYAKAYDQWSNDMTVDVEIKGETVAMTEQELLQKQTGNKNFGKELQAEYERVTYGMVATLENGVAKKVAPFKFLMRNANAKEDFVPQVWSWLRFGGTKTDKEDTAKINLIYDNSNLSFTPVESGDAKKMKLPNPVKNSLKYFKGKGWVHDGDSIVDYLKSIESEKKYDIKNRPIIIRTELLRISTEPNKNGSYTVTIEAGFNPNLKADPLPTTYNGFLTEETYKAYVKEKIGAGSDCVMSVTGSIRTFGQDETEGVNLNIHSIAGSSPDLVIPPDVANLVLGGDFDSAIFPEAIKSDGTPAEETKEAKEPEIATEDVGLEDFEDEVVEEDDFE